MRRCGVIPGWLLVLGTASILVAGPGEAWAQTMDDLVYTYLSFDKLEYVPGLDERPIEYEGELWIGGDFDRLWLKARGEQSTRETEGDAELQALYSRTVTAFWNAQAGLRMDRRYGGDGGRTRALLAGGIQGLAPYWLHLESFLFLSQDGDVSARMEAGYEMLFTQRLVLESEVELNAALQDVPEWGVGSGLSDVELGTRLRYEFLRELAPYVGFSWTRRYGATARFALQEGRSRSHGAWVVGLHWWY